MARQVINTGAIGKIPRPLQSRLFGDDTTADINANFTEIYAFLGGDTLGTGFTNPGIVFYNGTQVKTDADLTYNETTNKVTVGGDIAAGGVIELGHASDTTLARVAAGRVSIEGLGAVRGPATATDNAAARFDGTTGDLIQNSAVIIDDSGNVSGVVALSTTTIELGHASDTTLSRAAAGELAVEGVTIPNGAYRSVQVYTANATWTKPSGLKRIKVTVVGGGGSGGGANSGAGDVDVGSGGGAGGASIKTISAASLGTTETVTVGATVAGTAGANGTAGNTSSFGAHCSATGGGAGARAGAGAVANADAASGGSGSSGDINLSGGGASSGHGLFNSVRFGGIGGNSIFGAGGAARGNDSAGKAGGNYGGGGGGAVSNAASGSVAGGSGMGSAVIVEEFF